MAIIPPINIVVKKWMGGWAYEILFSNKVGIVGGFGYTNKAAASHAAQKAIKKYKKTIPGGLVPRGGRLT